jgi:hypothetical protein
VRPKAASSRRICFIASCISDVSVRPIPSSFPT